ncbi:hypothetical protein [Peribacillus sp. Hz7]|uniref:hypothetical protein n=1 Tax=Peribacillus sp. Hz7 TaxID=3344873 RepID=UPI0035CBA4AF
MEENQIEQQSEQVETEVQDATVTQDITLSDDIKELQKRIAEQKEALRKDKISFAFEREGLKDFTEFIHIEDDSKLDETVEKLKGLIDGIKAQVKQEAGYIPSEHRQEDAYSNFEKKKDVQGMLSTKLTNLFK